METAAYYAYPARAVEPTTHLLRDEPRLREILVRFPLSSPGFDSTEPVVEVEWFESRAPGRRPALVFNPILGGNYPLERDICRYLARHGIHVALIHRKAVKLAPEESVDHLELLLRQGLIRIRQVVDWLAAHERVDPDRLGSFGISMGGIASVMAAAVEPRLRAHVVALAGGGIPEILARSNDRLLARPRRRYLDRHRMDRTTLEALLRQRVRTDPLTLAPYVDGRRVLMFIAVADRTIGAANALRLWRALGKPRAVFLPLGHYTASLSLPYLKSASLRFFREAFR